MKFTGLSKELVLLIILHSTRQYLGCGELKVGFFVPTLLVQVSDREETKALMAKV
jgi:hypothetical protein